eukprot:scaffold433_cov257-Pinguiococcus_pyrenoidosus.AAC.7
MALGLAAAGGAAVGGLVAYFVAKRGSLRGNCPATAWPAGKPELSDAAQYPVYDLSKPAKQSFEEICDMLIEGRSALSLILVELGGPHVA